MHYSGESGLFDIITISLVLAFVIIAYIEQRYGLIRRNRKVDMASTPILMSYFTYGMDEIIPIKKGKIEGMNYSSLAILNTYGSDISGGSSFLYFVELPFESDVHLLGITKNAGGPQISPDSYGSIMEKVDLEGNYGDYFSLYAEKEMQVQSRYLLDPKAMAFTIDFCQSHDWEIVGSDLYFVRSFKMKSDDDPTEMAQDILPFINEIRPAIEKPAKKRILYHNSAINKSTSNFKCPICGQILVENDDYFKCNSGDGLLILGYKLKEIKNGKISNRNLLGHKNSEQEITCPAYDNKMVKLNYDGSGTIIDSCEHCPFRWVDAGELA